MVALRQPVGRSCDARPLDGLPAEATTRVSWCCISYDGYTTNLALEDFAAEDALLAHSWSGKPLDVEHGGPVRLVVPHLYFWKSAKWLQAHRIPDRGQARLLGSSRLSQPRRSLGRTALFRRLTLSPHVRRREAPLVAAARGSPNQGGFPCRPNAFNSRAPGATSSPPRWTCPTAQSGAYALFAHCFTCGKDVLAAKRIAVALAAKGIAVLRFDFTGLGSSEGDFANSTFSSNVADLVLAADHLRQTRKAPDDADRPQPRRRRDPRRRRANSGSEGGRHYRRAFRSRACHRACSRIVSRTSASRARWRSRSPAGRSSIKREFLDDIAEHRSDGECRQAAQGAAGDAFADRRHRRHRQRHAHFRRRQASEEFCVARRRRPSAEPARDAVYVADVIAAWAERYVEPPLPSRRPMPAKRRAASWCRRPAAASSSRPSPSARTACWPTSRLPPAARTAAPGPTILCWPGSAPARR